MISDGQIQAAFPQKMPVRGIIDAKSELGKTPCPKADPLQRCEFWVAGGWSIIFDVEFVRVCSEDFSRLCIVGLDGD